MKLKRLLITTFIIILSVSSVQAENGYVLENVTVKKITPKSRSLDPIVFDLNSKNDQQEVNTSKNNVLKGTVSSCENQALRDKGLIYYGFGGGEQQQIFGQAVFNDLDDENKHIQSLKFNMDGKIAPGLKYHTNFKAYNMFDKVDDAEVYSNSYLYTDIFKNHKLYFGQARLAQTDRQKINFIADLENEYGQEDVGIKLGGNHDIWNYSIGAYNSASLSSSDDSFATGGTLALNPIKTPKNLGELEFGGGYYAKEADTSVKSTYGLFSGYNFRKIYLKGELARKRDSLSQLSNDSVHFSNKLKVTNNLNFITKYNQVLDTQEHKNVFALEYSAGNNSLIKINNLKLELNASQVRDSSYDITQRYGFKTKYSF